MNVSRWSLDHRTVVLVLTAFVLVAGYQSYQRLGRLEDPSFPIKQAVVSAGYPGATPLEVAEEVAEPLESAIQQLDEVDYITSRSSMGQTTIKVYLKTDTPADGLQQVWDKLRRKVQAGAAKLPQGATQPSINDDFGDVYGVLFYIYGDGFTLEELHEQAKHIRKELLLVEGVASVELMGGPREGIFVDLLPERVLALGANLQLIQRAIEGQGKVTKAGSLDTDGQRLPIVPTGDFDSLESVREILILSPSGTPLRLGDIAKVTRAAITPHQALFRFNNYPAIALGVSAVAGGNVVDMGDAVKVRMEELMEVTPIGIELGVVSMQSDSVKVAVAGFTWGLMESVVIVVGVLLLAMGLRAGLLIGFILLLTIAGTFLIMEVMAVDLQRISLGALIIALGMLVDNAIVVVEGIIAGARKGHTREEAANQVVGQTTWPLLGATVIAVLAFAPIGLSPDSTGDYCGSLYTVIWVSLMLSWVFAITSTPVLGALVLETAAEGGQGSDPYDTPVFRFFGNVLRGILRQRYLSLAVVAVLLVAGVVGFGKARQGFFPSSARPQFLVEFWQQQGTRIETVDANLARLTEWVRTLDGVTDVAANAGMGAMRFELTYSAESPNPSYGQLMISVTDAGLIDGLREQIDGRIASEFPDVEGWSWRLVLGPGGEAKIQARLRGPDLNVLRQIGSRVEAVMAAEAYAGEVRTDWRQRESILRPELDDAQMARVGITRRDVGTALLMASDGMEAGVYREEDKLIPILLRSRDASSADLAALGDVLVPTASGVPVPLQQVSSQVSLGWHDPIIYRRDREPTLTVMCDPAAGSAAALFNRLRERIEAIPLPIGYTLEWGGEHEKTTQANAGLAALMPLCFGGMVFILIALFNNLRQPLIILLTVPLAIVGVTIGLLATGSEFGFMPILGVLSLTGMLIKNAIVLIDEANAQTTQGVGHFEAIVLSAISRARPVSMAAMTTVLGMIPLLTDVFFKDMAVVIMFGLTFATILTLVVVPLFYVVFYGAHPAPAGSIKPNGLG